MEEAFDIYINSAIIKVKIFAIQIRLLKEVLIKVEEIWKHGKLRNIESFFFYQSSYSCNRIYSIYTITEINDLKVAVYR